MSCAQRELVAKLLTESLAAWQVTGRVKRVDGGAIVVAGNGKSLRIDPAPPQQDMFRWLVTVDGRQRPAISVVAILRQVRQALDRGYAVGRVRITVAPLVPP